MRKIVPMILALTALVVASLACGLFSPEMSLTKLRLAFDEDGNSPTTVYAPSDVFYAVGELQNAPAGTVVKAVWRAAQIEGYEPDEIIYEQEINDFTGESFDGTIYFQLSNDSGWAVGVYKVDILLNGTLIASLPFSVR